MIGRFVALSLCRCHQLTQLPALCLCRSPPPVSYFAFYSMAGSYTFDAWSVADLGDFERHCSNSLSKLTGEDAKLISDFDAMKGLMRKYDAVELMWLHPHLVGINPMNRDEKLMSAAEMSAKGAKIVNVGASRDLCDFNRAWATQDDPVKRESWNWTAKTAAISDHFGKPAMEYKAK